MDPIFKPLTKEKKAELEKRGYKEWEYLGIAKWADPDSNTCYIYINNRPCYVCDNIRNIYIR